MYEAHGRLWGRCGEGDPSLPQAYLVDRKHATSTQTDTRYLKCRYVTNMNLLKSDSAFRIYGILDISQIVMVKNAGVGVRNSDFTWSASMGSGPRG